MNNKLVKNTAWIIMCKIIQAVLALVVTMLTARYLGPSNYGLISYASSMVAFAVPIMQLGLRSTLVQEFIENPDSEGEIIGTSLIMTIISSIACIITLGCLTFVLNAGKTETILVCVIYSFSLFFGAIEMIQYWFQSKLLSKYPSIVMLCSYIFVSVYKIYLLITEKSIYWFALSFSLDYAIIGFSLILIHKKISGIKFSYSSNVAKRMFMKSKYYIISGLMVTIFANTDKVMLSTMIGDIETGYYAASVACTSITGFVFGAIIDSSRPVILSSRKESIERFEQNISRLYSVVFYLAVAQGIAFTLFAKIIISILYGSAYISSIPILKIVVWYIAFSYMGSVRNIWILAENKQRYLWIINLSGALMNIIINACLIPIWGACGAAIASVLTQFFTNFVVGFILKPIRENNKLLLRGLNPKTLFELTKYIKVK